MKKIRFAIATALMSLALYSCNNNTGTYYPNYNEMSENLENKGYSVRYEDNSDDIPCKMLFAEKKDEFIEFYWIDDSEHNKEIEDILNDKYDKYDKMISISNDDNFGNLVFCSSNKALKDSGIKIVDVKVKVN